MRNNYSGINLESYTHNSPKNYHHPIKSQAFVANTNPTPTFLNHQPKSTISCLLSLLKYIKISSQELQRLQNIDNIDHLLLCCTPIVKNRYDQLIRLTESYIQQLQQLKLNLSKQELDIQQLTESITKLNAKESSLKLQNSDLQKQWQSSNQTILKLRKQIQQLDNQLFDKNKVMTNSQQENRILKTNTDLLTKQLLENIQLRKQKQRECQRDKESLRLQQFQVFKILQIKQQEIEQINIKYNLVIQENEIAQRECLRWKQRYQAQKQQMKMHKCIAQDKYNKNNVMKKQKLRVDWSDNEYEQYEYSNSPSHRTDKELKPSILLNNDKRIRQLTEQLKNLNEKFKHTNQEKIRLYVELEQIKELLLLHGIQYDHIEDAPIIQLIRKQKQRQSIPQYKYKQ